MHLFNEFLEESNRKGWEKDKIAPVNIFSEGSDKDKYIYNQEIVQKTLQSLKNVDILKEDIIQKLVDDIYTMDTSKKTKKNLIQYKNILILSIKE